MERRDIEICKEIGQLIYDAAPVGSTRIVMRTELAEEGGTRNLNSMRSIRRAMCRGLLVAVC